MKTKKGFYFSFDAFLALMVMTGSLLVVSMSSDVSNDSFQANTISYQSASTVGQDAMRLASRQDFYTLEESFRTDLVDNTVMRQEDLNRSILDGITLMWAARNFTYAEQTAERYLESRVPEDMDYRLQVNEEGSKTNIYQTEPIPSDAEAVASVSRLVSGHKIDKPSEGFQARARAVQATTNQTKVVDIPMMGSGAFTNDLEINKTFYVPAKEVHTSKLYLSMQWGQSNFDSATIEVNGNDVVSKADMQIKEDGSAHYGFGEVDIAQEVQPGWNSFTVNFPNQDSQGDYNARFQPGTRIETVYTQDVEKVKSRDWRYLTDVLGESSNKNNRGGVWYNYPLQVPKGNVSEAVLELDIRNLEDHNKKDLQVYINEKLLHNQSAPVNDVVELNFSEHLHEGTNVLSIYGNVELSDGKVTDFLHEGNNGPGPRIYSDPTSQEGSRVKLSYESPGGGLEFGLIDITWTREIGSDVSEPLDSESNPAYFNHSYDEEFEIINSYLNVVQLNSINVTHRAGIDSLEDVFVTPRTYAIPSKIETGEDLVDGGETTRYWYSDTCNDGSERKYCEVLPESGIEIELGLPSQVGYGKLYENESAALEDAKQRLEEQLGRFAEATEIASDTVSTGSQPYLWGPASVKLVVWK